MDWSDVLAIESVEEEEMSMISIGFSAWMRKRTEDSEDEPAPTSDGKCLRQSSPDEEVEKYWAIIPMDSLDRVTNDQWVSEGTLNEVSAHLEEGIPVGGPNAIEIGEGSPSGVAAAPLPPPRPTDFGTSRRRPPDQK